MCPCLGSLPSAIDLEVLLDPGPRQMEKERNDSPMLFLHTEFGEGASDQGELEHKSRHA